MVSVPDRVPILVGVKVTPMAQEAPTFDPQVVAPMAKSPVATAETERPELRWFVSVTGEDELVVFTLRLGNVRAAGETVTGTEPVPLNATVCGLDCALSAKVNAPVRAPRAFGEKVTVTVHMAPAAMPVPQLLAAITKSPVVAMLVKLSLAFSWLVSAMALAEVLLPTATVPKLSVVGDSVTGATPVPVRAIDCGLVEALSEITTEAERADAIDGVNVTEMVQVLPAFSVPELVGQVPPNAKSLVPEIAMLLMVSGTV